MKPQSHHEISNHHHGMHELQAVVPEVNTVPEWEKNTEPYDPNADELLVWVRDGGLHPEDEIRINETLELLGITDDNAKELGIECPRELVSLDRWDRLSLPEKYYFLEALRVTDDEGNPLITSFVFDPAKILRQENFPITIQESPEIIPHPLSGRLCDQRLQRICGSHAIIREWRWLKLSPEQRAAVTEYFDNPPSTEDPAEQAPQQTQSETPEVNLNVMAHEIATARPRLTLIGKMSIEQRAGTPKAGTDPRIETVPQQQPPENVPVTNAQRLRRRAQVSIRGSQAQSALRTQAPTTATPHNILSLPQSSPMAEAAAQTTPTESGARKAKAAEGKRSTIRPSRLRRMRQVFKLEATPATLHPVTR